MLIRKAPFVSMVLKVGVTEIMLADLRKQSESIYSCLSVESGSLRFLVLQPTSCSLSAGIDSSSPHRKYDEQSREWMDAVFVQITQMTRSSVVLSLTVWFNSPTAVLESEWNRVGAELRWDHMRPAGAASAKPSYCLPSHTNGTVAAHEGGKICPVSVSANQMYH